MAPAGSERRTAARAAVSVELRLARKAGRAVSARTLDLGAGGARVTSDRPLRIDETLHFDFDLPSGRAHCDGTARVLRQDRHDVYALRFEQLADAQVAELRAFLDATAAARPV
jgi:PilZ domain